MLRRTATAVARGVGLVVLKRLSTAVKDWDRLLLAVIRASAVNQENVPSGGFTVAERNFPEAVIREPLISRGSIPGDIDYVEAHGTGTPLGDPIEIGALASALGPGRLAKNPTARRDRDRLNTGHRSYAAGIAGLIKVLLAYGELRASAAR